MKTSLYEKHVALGAKMVDFAGFEMPIQYKNLKEEVLAVRNGVGVFDVSHMGEFFVTGPDAAKYVNYMITNNIEKLSSGKAIYSPLCNHDGKIIDDLIAYKFSDEEILICVNASNIEKDFNWFKENTGDFNVELKNESDKYSLLAIQGPKTFETIKEIELLSGLKDADYYSIQKLDNGIILARTGYTGEDGFEVFAPHNIIDKLWDELIERGVTPCGLGSRDVLRLEVCFPLYGNELNEDLTPLDCGLAWTTKLDKDNFIGKAALTDYKAQKKLIKLTLDKGIPRAGYKLIANEQPVGEITSGSMSVVLSKGIALALVNKEFEDYDKLKIDIRNKLYDTTRVTKPFVSGGHK
tara:strand:+ start:76101 stop:77156 length:1056 start_codon:yes stop_codon:yes gene_type:complete